jgi:hypothetical protein
MFIKRFIPLLLILPALILLGCQSTTTTEITAQTEPQTAVTPATTTQSTTPRPTNTATPQPTHTPTVTPTPDPSATPTQTPTPTATPIPVNGLTLNNFLIMPPETIANIRTIYRNGQQWGRNTHNYSILGDSTVLNPHLLARFGRDDLNLGPYTHLQPTVENFADSWSRYGVAAQHGLHSWSIFDPFWANENWCLPEEDILTCEFRLQNPAFLFIRLGSNDAGAPSGFDYNLRQAAQAAIANGVIPILITKPDRFEGDDTNNTILRQIAADMHLPLWDLDLVASTLPGKGLDTDQVHMVDYPDNDYNNPAAYSSGHAMQDLSGLIVLDALLHTVQSAEP